MTEEQLIKECVARNEKAQRLLYERFASKMMGVCLRYCRDKSEAKDILQEGFIKVFENIDSFKGTGSLEGWVRRVIVNKALDNIRKNKKMRHSVNVDDVSYQLPKHDHIEEKMMADDLLKLVQQLPDGFRTVFNLYAIEGYSHKEIADKLEISENTSKSQYSRARAHLRKMLEELQNREALNSNNSSETRY